MAVARWIVPALLTLTLVVVLFAPGRVPASAWAALVNGDFDQDTEGWSVTGGAIFESVATPARTGQAALFTSVADAGLQTQEVYQRIPGVVSGGTYGATAWVYLNDPGIEEVRLILRFHASEDGFGEEYFADYVALTDTQSAAWQELRILPVVPPPTARSLTIRLQASIENPGSAHQFAVDDVTLDGVSPTPTPTATTTPAVTPSPSPTATPPATTPTPGPTPSPAPTGTPAATPAPAPSPTATPTPPPGTPGPACQLLITEVSVDDREWVELANAGNANCQLGDFTLKDNTRGEALPAAIVPPGAIVLVTGRDTPWPTMVQSAPPILVRLNGATIGNGLARDADMLVLEGPGGATADALNWGTPSPGWANWHPGLWNPGPTLTAARPFLVRHAGSTTASASAWQASATSSPGASNPFLAALPVGTKAGSGGW